MGERDPRLRPRTPRRVLLVLTLVFTFSVPAAGQVPQQPAIVVDRDMTVAAGAIDLLTVQRALVRLEDRFLPHRFDETTSLRRALGIGYRLGKWFALDLPVDHFLMVVAHEVYGHGARLRALNAPGIRYGFDLPIPYGGGGGSTAFAGDVRVTRADLLAIDTAGIEAQNVLADDIAQRALGRGALHYRESWLYLESRLSGLGYIRSVSARSGPGHDVARFLRDFGDACNPPTCTPLDAATLKRRALLILADPFLAYAAYGMAVTYLVHGRPSARVPMVRLADEMHYLPALRFELTPYGTEWTTEHNLVRRERLTRVAFRIGDTGASRAWGIGLLATDVVRRGRMTAGPTVAVWRQPPLDSAAQSLETGGLAMVTVNVALGGTPDAPPKVGLWLQGGYKSDGYARGEHLRAGPVLRIGLTLNLLGS